ncbi:hypothetical protein AGR4C_Cc70037 [Agrobacterium tumefaciens str. Kerr 14]|uniref:Uncharacterized protein n=1 Tax=Agrobacterium tumefaciens str. Kerr 14 TaxID=1183424 RepID=A0A1S7QAA9_AGRTU|nr:hypothetical protein AGR4C_Cc70037 [Agrobacterium tumefaciens str. Kerr 14]
MLERLLSAQGLGLAGCRIRSSMTEVYNRENTQKQKAPSRRKTPARNHIYEPVLGWPECFSALAEIREDCRGTRHADLLHGSACGHLFVCGCAETMVALTGARAEARQTERFKAGMYRTEASGHCLGSLNRIPPKT